MPTTPVSNKGSPVAKAWEKLHEAEASLAELRAAKTLNEAERRWKAVLVALNALWKKANHVAGRSSARAGAGR
jgi:hypothetical protein